MQLYSFICSKKDKKFDCFVILYPNEDHAGGADVVITKFDIRKDEYMKENNNRQYAMDFMKSIEKLLKNAHYCGKKNWGDPSGESDGLDTYEIKSKNGKKIWCATVEYVNSRTREPNRCGFLATFPIEKKKSLGSSLAVLIPYEYSRRFSTMAFCDENRYEIRNYGKLTVGRTGIRKQVFLIILRKNIRKKSFWMRMKLNI